MPISSSDRLAPQALKFAVRCHAGRRRESDGEPFIRHPLEVARLLRDAGCSESVVSAGLLHDVVEDGHVRASELSVRFGDGVAALVAAVTDDSCVASYRRRKQVQRDHVRFVGGDAALLFAADSVAHVREWPGRIQRQPVRLDDLPADRRARPHLEHHQDLRLEHYRATLTMLERVAPGQPARRTARRRAAGAAGAAAQPRMNGLTAARISSISLALSNPRGAGGLLRTSRIIAAWRASTCAIEPAAVSTSPDWISGPAPL